MAENIVNARIQLKNDSETNWNQAINFIPRKGEIIIYNADTEHPYPRFKVGDGTTTVIGLPFSNFEAQKVAHKLFFGAGGIFEYDGSADLTVPVYTGNVFSN